MKQEIKYQQLSMEDALKTYAEWLMEQGIKSPEYFFKHHGEWYMLSYPLRTLMLCGKLYGKREYVDLAFEYIDIYLSEQLPNGAFTSNYRRQPTEKLTKKEFHEILRTGKVNIADVGSNVTWIIQAATYADAPRREKYLGAVRRWLDNWVPLWALPEGGYGNGIWCGHKLNAPYTCAMSTLVMALSAFSLVTGEDEYVGNAERCMEFQCSKWLDNGLPLFLNCYPWIREQALDDYGHSYYLLEGMCWTHYVSRNKKVRALLEKRMSEMIFGKAGLLSQWDKSWFSFTNTFQPLPLERPSSDMVSSRAGATHGWELAKSNGIMHTFLYYLNHIEENPELRGKTELGLKYLSNPLKARMSGVAAEIEEGYGKFAMQATGFAGLSLLEGITKDSVFDLKVLNGKDLR
jgi:hypothetical protein